MQEKFSRRKAQTALEYIAACLVFATVGIGSFLAINQTALLSTRGTQDNYSSADTLLGKTLADGIPQGERTWPAAWAEPQEGLGGALAQDTADIGAEQASTWTDAKENDVLAQSGGKHWVDSADSAKELNFPEVSELNTPSGAQAGFNTLTRQYLSQNEAGYPQEDQAAASKNLNKDWFMHPPAREPAAGE